MATTAAAHHRNFGVLLVQGVFVEIARNLAGPRLVLPFLYLAFGAPVFLAGALIPLIQLSRVAGQILCAPFINATPVLKWYMVTGSVVIALALSLAGLAADLTSVHLVAVTFLIAVAGVGFGQAISRIAFQHMLGSVMTEDRRGALLFTQTAVSGVVAIAVAWLLHRIFSDVGSLDSHLTLLWGGVVGYLVAAVLATALQESRTGDVEPRQSKASSALAGYFDAIRSGTAETFREPWFRRFVVARFLLGSVELAMPFYAIHAASLHASTQGSLSVFVIAASAGLVVCGPLWQRLSRVSLPGLLNTACAFAVVAGAIAIAIENVPLLRHEICYGLVFFLVSAANQGVSSARKIYLAEAAPPARRAYYIAGAESVVGMIGLPFAFALAALAHLQHVVWPIYLLLAMNATAMVSALFLMPTHRHDHERTGVGAP